MTSIKNLIYSQKQKLFYMDENGKKLSYKRLTYRVFYLTRRTDSLEECIWLIRRRLDEMPETEETKLMKAVIDDYNFFDE